MTDETSTTTTTATTSTTTEEDAAATVTPQTLKDLLHNTKVDGGKRSLWSKTIETFGMADGKTTKEDILVADKAEGLAMLRSLVESKATEYTERLTTDTTTTTTTDQDAPNPWSFSVSPLADFDATLDDLLTTFLTWSYKKGASKGSTTVAPLYNVSKAFHRLDGYVQWMHDSRADLSVPLDDATKRDVHELWGRMKLTQSTTTTTTSDDTKKTTLVWWIDLSAMKNMKGYDHGKTLHMLVWLCHLALFTPHDDMVIMERFGPKISMYQMFTLMPPDLGAKVDRLFIGVLPFRTSQFYMLQSPRWMSVVLAMMKPFLSKKMRQRFTTVPAKKDLAAWLDETVGAAAIPVGFADVAGAVEQDLFATRIPAGTTATSSETDEL